MTVTFLWDLALLLGKVVLQVEVGHSWYKSRLVILSKQVAFFSPPQKKVNTKHKGSATFQEHLDALGPNSSVADPYGGVAQGAQKPVGNCRTFAPSCHHCVKRLRLWFGKVSLGREAHSEQVCWETASQTYWTLCFYAVPFSSKQAKQLVNVIIGQCQRSVLGTTKSSKVRTVNNTFCTQAPCASSQSRSL